jgi:hypothetical protein
MIFISDNWPLKSLLFWLGFWKLLLLQQANQKGRNQKLILSSTVLNAPLTLFLAFYFFSCFKEDRGIGRFYTCLSQIAYNFSTARKPQALV